MRLPRRVQVWWDSYEGNPKNWTIKDEVENIHNARIAYGFLAGLSLAIVFEQMTFLSIWYKLFLSAIWILFLAALTLFDRHDVKAFKKKYPDQEVFD